MLQIEVKPCRLVPVKNFVCEEDERGRLVCELDGGRIVFDQHGGRVSVDVLYDIMPDYGTHAGPFSSVEDAAYGITHGVIPRRLAALLYANGILAESE